MQSVSWRQQVKIICLEEHVVDADIAKASQSAQTSEAGYMADWGSRVADKPALTDKRPALCLQRSGSHCSRRRRRSYRCHGSAQHRHAGFNYSNSPLLVPARQAVELTRAAHYRLAPSVHATGSDFGLRDIISYSAKSFVATEPRKHLPVHSPA